MVDKEDIEKLWQDVKTKRDELRVQAHLAKAEMKELWDELEGKWNEFEPKARQVAGATAEASKDVGGAVKDLGKEILAGYERIKKSL